MSREALRIGGKVWRRLVDAGGYVYTAADGKMSIHFNKGYAPTKELVSLVQLHRQELRLFVADWHARDDARRTATLPVVGSFRPESKSTPQTRRSR